MVERRPLGTLTTHAVLGAGLLVVGFPLYVTLAAMFFPGHPVRLANDRYEQFQSGIKRHAFSTHTRMGVDRTTAKIFAFAADHVLHAGGLMNFSPMS